MSTATGLLTVEDFLQLPESNDGSQYELIAGELVSMTAPKRPHLDVQHKLQVILFPLVSASHVMRLEFPFSATAVDFFRADLAIVSASRYALVVDYLIGCPEMVVEIESPSNTPSELDEKEAICLANGCKEFWVVYPRKRYVRVATGETTRRYREGDHIPLALFPSQTISVTEIFSILPNS